MEVQTKIKAIDILSCAVLDRIDKWFIHDAIIEDFSHKLVDNTMNHWFGNKEDFFGFYNYSFPEVKRKILEVLEIESFYDVIDRYISFCISSSPVVLKDISSSAWQTVQENQIDLYGGTKDWSMFWLNATDEGKQDFLKYIESKFDEAVNTLPF